MNQRFGGRNVRDNRPGLGRGFDPAPFALPGIGRQRHATALVREKGAELQLAAPRIKQPGAIEQGLLLGPVAPQGGNQGALLVPRFQHLRDKRQQHGMGADFESNIATLLDHGFHG